MRTLGWAVAIAFVATTGIGAGQAQATLIFKLETAVEGGPAPETEPAALESESNKEEGFEFTSFTDKHGRHEGGNEPDLLSSTSPEGKSAAANFAEWTQAGNHPHHGGKKKGRGSQQGGGGSGSGNRNSSGSGNSSTNGSSANGTGNAPSGGSNSGVNGSSNGGSNGSSNGGSSNNGSSNGGSSNGGGSNSGSSNNGGSNGGTSGGGSNGDSSNGNSNGASNGGGSSSGDGSSGGGTESSSSSSDGGSPAFNNPPPSDLGNSPLEYVPDSLPPAVNIAAVPEPSTLLMGGLALIGFGLARFRGSKKS